MEKQNLYQDLRWMALRLPIDDYCHLMEETDSEVYGAVVDMDLEEGTATLACMLDGTVSMYFTTGGGLIGLGQEYENVRKTALSFLVNSPKVIEKMLPAEEARDFALPNNLDHRVYLLTADGTRALTIHTEVQQEMSDTEQFLFFLYQSVITEISKVR